MQIIITPPPVNASAPSSVYNNLPTIKRMPLLNIPTHVNKGSQESVTKTEKWVYAVCPICKLVQKDVYVHPNSRKSKLQFCSSNCSEVFRSTLKIKDNAENVKESSVEIILDF